MHLGARVGDPVLDGLLLGQQRAVRVARERALAHHVEGPLGLAEPAHAVVDAAGAEARLGELEPRALRADQVVGGHAHVLVDDLGVVAEPAVHDAGVVHRRRRRARSCTPGVVDGHDEHRAALVGVHVGVRHRHHDEDVGDRAVRRVPLASVDAPTRRRRAPPGSVSSFGSLPGRVRLGHGEPRAHRPVEQRLEPPLADVVAASQLHRRRPAARRCPSPARCCRRRAAPSGDWPRISCIRPSRTWPNPMPPSSGGRCAAHSPRSRTSSWSGRDELQHVVVGRARASRSGRSPRARTPRIHASCCLELRLGLEVPRHGRLLAACVAPPR